MIEPPEATPPEEQLHQAPDEGTQETPSERRRIVRALADRWTAIAAISISVVSLVIGMMHGRTMDRLVKANSWPFLQFESGNTTPDQQVAISFSIANSGVGPARLETLQVLYEGQPVANSRELLRACCLASGRAPTAAELGTIITSPVAPHMIPANRELQFFYWRRPEGGSPVWDSLDKARFNMAVKGCYCSVFDECWSSDLAGGRPAEVASCDADSAILYRE
jgi:hypothetical protein